MKIDFGYVAMSMIVKDCSPSKTITLKYLEKIEDPEARISRLKSIAKTNINNTQRLFYHNKAHDIRMYRLTSKLLPLATHPITKEWNWIKDLEEDFKVLGNYAKKNGFRISAHPDHYTVLNTPKEDVLEASIKDLIYHNDIYKAMDLDEEAKLVLHIGGRYDSKEKSIHRFINNFSKLPKDIKKRIILENDDKTYTVKEVLDICEQLNVPMVLDIHHHWCNNNNEDISNFIEPIFKTWDDEGITPKIHISSPKDEKNFRSHADNVDASSFMEFLKKAKDINRDFNVMIEAKNKDLALFNLMEDLKKRNDVTIIDQASIEY